MNAAKPTPTAIPTGLPGRAGFYRLTVEQYHRMIESNAFTEDDKVELLGGYLVNKMPQGFPHGATVEWLTERLVQSAPSGWRVRVQLPITLADSEPEPDVAVVRGDRRTFTTRHPGPSDFGIVIEVAVSSLLEDRRVKGFFYAQAGIPVYWIVNVADRVIEVYTDPDPAADPPAYRTRTDVAPGQDVPLVLDGVEVGRVPVADLLP